LVRAYSDIIGKFSAFFYVGIKDATYQFILVVHGGSYPVKDTYQGISPATKNSQFYFLAHKCFSLKVYISISFVLTSSSLKKIANKIITTKANMAGINQMFSQSCFPFSSRYISLIWPATQKPISIPTP